MESSEGLKCLEKTFVNNSDLDGSDVCDLTSCTNGQIPKSLNMSHLQSCPYCGQYKDNGNSMCSSADICGHLSGKNDGTWIRKRSCNSYDATGSGVKINGGDKLDKMSVSDVPPYGIFLSANKMQDLQLEVELLKLLLNCILCIYWGLQKTWQRVILMIKSTFMLITRPWNFLRKAWQGLVSMIWEKEDFVTETDGMVKENGCHHIADSLFSTDSGYNDFRGFLNLAMILLVLTCTRLSLENIIKYGILVNPIPALKVFINEPYSWPNFSLVLFSNFFILVAYCVECLLAKKSLSEGFGHLIHTVNQLLCITLPAGIILWKHPSPVFSSITLTLHTCYFLKLYSYADVNKWCRKELHMVQSKISRRSRNKSVANFANLSEEGVANGSAIDSYQKYPDNLNLNDIYFFMLSPTLCYELNFPRSARIRKRFLIKRCCESIFLTGLFVSLIQQWIIPTINNSTIPFKNSDFPRITERLLKLAVPNLALWLMFFYTFFHSLLNINAEIMRFGDRVFYRDWWNAESVTYFWSNWNIPVHKWALRHVYKPLLHGGCSRLQASIAVFLISAFFHEYLVSIPLRMFRLWAFLAMLGQVPFAFFVQRFLHGKYGNMAVWMSIIIGQPFAVLMYYHDYYILNQ